MNRNKREKERKKNKQTKKKQMSKPQATVLALWRLGMVLARS